jgi:hypothetical protein
MKNTALDALVASSENHWAGNMPARYGNSHLGSAASRIGSSDRNFQKLLFVRSITSCAHPTFYLRRER